MVKDTQCRTLLILFVCRLSSSWLRELRRLAKKVPDERNSTRDMHRLVDMELYQTLRTVEGRIVTRPLPQIFRFSLESEYSTA